MIRRLLFAVVALLLTTCSLWAGPPADGVPLEPQAMAARIDELLAQSYQKAGVAPAPTATDAAYLRRVWFDVAGKTPPITDVRRFLDDTSADKRTRTVEQLLDGPGYISHFTNVYRNTWLPEGENNYQIRFVAQGFDTWLRNKLADNTSYDQVVRELLTASVAQGRNGPFDAGRKPGPYGFFFGKEMKPENLASATSRLFLGVRLECAQCHDHPFAKWKRDQFWNMTAFFAGIQARHQDGFLVQVRELPDRREMAIPGTDRVAQALFLDGKEPQWKPNVDARVTLAEWITSPANDQFAKATVNRFWAHFLGTGIVEPFDDFKDDNPPSHPEILDELARQFVLHKWDLKYLVRTLTATKAYQMSSAGPDMSAEEKRQFARMPVRGLTPEQLFDSFTQATGYKDPTTLRARAFAFNSARNTFLAKFDRTERMTEMATSIPQALALMNNKIIADMTSLDKGETLPAIVDAPFLDTTGKIEALYLSGLGRKPRSEELAKLVPYVESGGPKKDSRRALGDVFWAILNSAEFILNH